VLGLADKLDAAGTVGTSAGGEVGWVALSVILKRWGCARLSCATVLVGVVVHYAVFVVHGIDSASALGLTNLEGVENVVMAALVLAEVVDATETTRGAVGRVKGEEFAVHMLVLLCNGANDESADEGELRLGSVDESQWG